MKSKNLKTHIITKEVKENEKISAVRLDEKNFKPIAVLAGIMLLS